MNSIVLRYGLCSINVQATNEITQKYLTDSLRILSPWVQASNEPAAYTLVVISPDPDQTPEIRWRTLSSLWAQARQGLEHEREPSVLAAWRALYSLGTLIDHRVFLFQEGGVHSALFFCLLPSDTLKRSFDPAAWIIHAIKALGVYWHAARGGGVFHASGVARREQGYLFLGPSGAGKSTAAGLSEQVQGSIVHDDQVMISKNSAKYLLAYPGNPVAPALRAVFVLRQSNLDQVKMLAPGEVCAALTRSILEYALGQDVFGSWVRQAFHNAANIARCTPGYELYFRKSPDFWNAIDAELRD